MRLCRDNIPFIWWTDREGEYHQTVTVQYAMDALGISDIDLASLKPNTVITRLLTGLGYSNSRTRGPQQFSVRGEYAASSNERLSTVVDFFGKDIEVRLLQDWEKIERVLSMTPYPFYLRECAGVFHYLTTAK